MSACFVSCMLALVGAVACSGGPGSLEDTDRHADERPPPSREDPGSSPEHPNGCLDCSRPYVCAAGGDQGQLEMTPASNGCLITSRVLLRCDRRIIYLPTGDVIGTWTSDLDGSFSVVSEEGSVVCRPTVDE